MAVFSRKPRDINKLLEDPQFPFMVGRLMGAGEMTSHWLMIREDAEAQQIGKRLAQVVEWFFTEEEPKTRPQPDSEAQTQVRRPSQ